MTTGNFKEKGCQHAGVHKLIHWWVIKRGPAPPITTKQLSGFDLLEAVNSPPHLTSHEYEGSPKSCGSANTNRSRSQPKRPAGVLLRCVLFKY